MALGFGVELPPRVSWIAQHQGQAILMEYPAIAARTITAQVSRGSMQ